MVHAGVWSTLVCKKMKRHLKRPAWLKRDLLSELKHQKKCVENGSKDGLHLEECGSIDWVGRVELGKAIAHLELKLVKNMKAVRRTSADTLKRTSRRALA